MKVCSRENIQDNLFPDESVKAKAPPVGTVAFHLIRPCNVYLAPSHRLYTCFTGVCCLAYLQDRITHQKYPVCFLNLPQKQLALQGDRKDCTAH